MWKSFQMSFVPKVAAMPAGTCSVTSGRVMPSKTSSELMSGIAAALVHPTVMSVIAKHVVKALFPIVWTLLGRVAWASTPHR